MSYSRDFATGSKVCCDGTVIGTSLSPTQPLPDNTYYWRVRAVDVDGNVGVWNPASADASRFEKVFDKAAALGRPSITNLHMRDDRNDPAPAGPTQTPVVVWDQVPGASSYLVEVDSARGRLLRLELTGRALARQHGDDRLDAARLPAVARRRRTRTSSAIRGDSVRLTAGKSYCVRVRAKSDTDSNRADVYGDFAYLNGPDQVAFTFAGYPCPTNCTRGYLRSRRLPDAAERPDDDAVLHLGRRRQRGQLVRASSRRIPEFHNIVDYAWTQVRAYAPRSGVESDHVPGRDDRVLLGRPSGRRLGRQDGRRRPALGLAGEVRQAVDAAAARHSRGPRERGRAARLHAGRRSKAPAATTCRSRARTTSASCSTTSRPRRSRTRPTRATPPTSRSTGASGPRTRRASA